MITINGQNLGDTVFVDFDGEHVIPTTKTATKLTVKSPDHGPGIVHLRVHTTDAVSPSTAADNFNYLNRPVLTGVSPAMGSVNGGAAVTITGTGLSGATEVLFGAVSVPPAQVQSGMILVYSPQHSAGIVDVRVRTPGGLSNVTASARYSYIVAGPVVTGISPTFGPTTGGTIVTISGSGFLTATTVTFGGTGVAPLQVTDSLVRVVAPAHAAGLVHVRVTTTLGTSVETDLGDFTYVSGVPNVQSVFPRSGPTTGGTLLTIVGTGFTGATRVHFDGLSVVPQSVTETRIEVQAPPHSAGVVHLLVTTPAGTSVESVRDDYTYGTISPQVTSIFPKSGPSTGGTRVTILGSGFSTAVGVSFGDQVVEPASVTATSIEVVSPPHFPGRVHLRVITPTVISPETSADDFVFGGLPIVTSISPASGSVDGGTEVVINGSGFTGARLVSFGDSSVAPHFVSENQIRVVAPRAPSGGVAHLRVTTDAGISEATPADNFTYVSRPVVSGISPSTGSNRGGTLVVIHGVGFTGATIVNFGGVGVVPVIVTDTEIQVYSPAHASGLVHLRISSTGGISPDSNADDFTFVPPGPEACPVTPLWVNDLAYGSAGGGFYWDPPSGMVWTAQRNWHFFAPQPSRPAPQPLWVDALTYGSAGGGFYWDPVSGQVWTAERDWHAYQPQGCVAR